MSSAPPSPLSSLAPSRPLPARQVLALLALVGLVGCKSKPDRIAEARQLLPACEARLALLPGIDAKLPDLIRAGPTAPDFGAGPRPLKLAWGSNDGSPTYGGYNAVLVTRWQITGGKAPKTVVDELGALGSTRFRTMEDHLVEVRAALAAADRGDSDAAAKLPSGFTMGTEKVTDVRYLVLTVPTEYVAPQVAVEGGKAGFRAGKIGLLAMLFDLAEGGKHIGSIAVETESDPSVKFEYTKDSGGAEIARQAESKLGYELVKKAGAELAKRLAAL